ncbi:MAG: 50S ribosomal protein L21 [Deltaproteobacteria bacterium]|jgi:large subunit ribosomal protein L21|nr:50S ribosomal protein L21 [Deltaproteobacteria bacterium]
MYAVVVAGGKQHRVRAGELLKVEKIEGEIGTALVLDRVLMLGGDGEPRIGTPVVEGAMVKAEIVRQGRNKKLLVFKKRRRKNYRRMYGHRQPYTHLRITGIEVK